MKCPNDQTTLLLTERHGIEIDYCPECRGVWLDRGELDKILDQANGQINPEAEQPVPVPSTAPRKSGEDKQDYYTGDYHGDSYKKKRRKESFLSDLFDF